MFHDNRKNVRFCPSKILLFFFCEWGWMEVFQGQALPDIPSAFSSEGNFRISTLESLQLCVSYPRATREPSCGAGALGPCGPWCWNAAAHSCGLVGKALLEGPGEKNRNKNAWVCCLFGVGFLAGQSTTCKGIIRGVLSFANITGLPWSCLESRKKAGYMGGWSDLRD